MAPKNTSSDIAAQAAIALAKAASDTATELAKSSHLVATSVSTMQVDVTYIKTQLGNLTEKFENLATKHPTKEDHVELKAVVEKVDTRLSTLENRFWLAQGAVTALVLVLKFLIPGVG